MLTLYQHPPLVLAFWDSLEFRYATLATITSTSQVPTSLHSLHRAARYVFESRTLQMATAHLCLCQRIGLLVSEPSFVLGNPRLNEKGPKVLYNNVARRQFLYFQFWLPTLAGLHSSKIRLASTLYVHDGIFRIRNFLNAPNSHRNIEMECMGGESLLRSSWTEEVEF